jgi:hypothetical protein
MHPLEVEVPELLLVDVLEALPPVEVVAPLALEEAPPPDPPEPAEPALGELEHAVTTESEASSAAGKSKRV